MNDKKEGFSYESPEKQRKSAARLLIVEFAALVIVVVTIFGILTYLNIIPIRSIISELFNPAEENNLIEQSTTGQAITTGRDIEVVEVEPVFKVDSEVEGKKIILRDKEGLLRKLNNWNLYGRPYNDEAAGSTNGESLKEVRLVLTNEEQKVFSHKDQDGIFVGSGLKLENQTLILSIYLSPRVLRDSQRSLNLLNQQMLFTLEAIAKNAKTDTVINDILRNNQDLMTKLRETDSYYVRFE